MSVLSEEELSEIVEVVWMTVLELPVSEGHATELLASECITAGIVISGAWQGSVKVRASQEFMSLAASRMFSIPIEDVEQEDRIDTLTELTNMLGGTVKCLLPETCDLALPSITQGEYEDPAGHEWLHFVCEEHPLAVAVIAAHENVSVAA